MRFLLPSRLKPRERSIHTMKVGGEEKKIKNLDLFPSIRAHQVDSPAYFGLIQWWISNFLIYFSLLAALKLIWWNIHKDAQSPECRNFWTLFFEWRVCTSYSLCRRLFRLLSNEFSTLPRHAITRWKWKEKLASSAGDSITSRLFADNITTEKKETTKVR